MTKLTSRVATIDQYPDVCRSRASQSMIKDPAFYCGGLYTAGPTGYWPYLQLFLTFLTDPDIFFQNWLRDVVKLTSCDTLWWYQLTDPMIRAWDMSVWLKCCFCPTNLSLCTPLRERGGEGGYLSDACLACCSYFNIIIITWTFLDYFIVLFIIIYLINIIYFFCI